MGFGIIIADMRVVYEDVDERFSIGFVLAAEEFILNGLINRCALLEAKR